MKKVSIALDIKLMSPLHVTSMEKGRYMPNEPKYKQIRRGADDGGIPLTLTRELEVALAEAQVIGEGDAAFSKTVVRVPVMPANGIGGRLRRNAADLIAKSLQARGEKLSPRAYNTLAAGSPDASLLRSEASVEQVTAGKQHPYFGVFGGSSYALSADLVVHEGYPITRITEGLLRSPALLEVPDVREHDMTQAIPLVKKDDVKDVKNPEQLEAVIGVEATSEYIATIMRGREDKKARMAEEGDQSKKTELSTVAATQAATPGLHFALRLDLMVRSDAHLGLFLRALQRFVDPVTGGQFGGKAAKGYGRFSVVASNMAVYEEGALLDTMQLLTPQADGGYAFSTNPFVAAAVLAGDSFIDDVDAAELEKFASADANKQFKSRKAA